MPVLASSYLLILEGDHLNAAATVSPILRSSAASRRRRTAGLPGMAISWPPPRRCASGTSVTVAASNLIGLGRRSPRNFSALHRENQRSQCSALGKAEYAPEDATTPTKWWPAAPVVQAPGRLVAPGGARSRCGRVRSGPAALQSASRASVSQSRLSDAAAVPSAAQVRGRDVAVCLAPLRDRRRRPGAPP